VNIPYCSTLRGAAPFFVPSELLFIERDDVEPNFKDGINCPLWLATFHGHERALGLLLGRYDVKPDDHGLGTSTLLRVAASEGHDAVVRLLLTRSDVDPNAVRNDLGLTPLCEAAYKGHDAVVRLLLERSDIKPNIRSEIGIYPLSGAIAHPVLACQDILELRVV
jgi:ankyrin repeat protein